MAIIFNGGSNPTAVEFNGNTVNMVKYNGVPVWPVTRIIPITYNLVHKDNNSDSYDAYAEFWINGSAAGWSRISSRYESVSGEIEHYCNTNDTLQIFINARKGSFYSTKIIIIADGVELVNSSDSSSTWHSYDYGRWYVPIDCTAIDLTYTTTIKSNQVIETVFTITTTRASSEE